MNNKKNNNKLGPIGTMTSDDLDFQVNGLADSSDLVYRTNSITFPKPVSITASHRPTAFITLRFLPSLKNRQL